MDKDKIMHQQEKVKQDILHHIHNFEKKPVQCLDHTEQ